MGPPSYMRSILDRNFVLWRISVFRFPTEQEMYIQTGSGDHPVFYSRSNTFPVFIGVERPRFETDRSSPSCAGVNRNEWSHTAYDFMACIRFLYLCFIFISETVDLKTFTPLFSNKIFFVLLVITRGVRKVKNVCAFNPRSCVIVPDQALGVFSKV